MDTTMNMRAFVIELLTDGFEEEISEKYQLDEYEDDEYEDEFEVPKDVEARKIRERSKIRHYVARKKAAKKNLKRRTVTQKNKKTDKIKKAKEPLSSIADYFEEIDTE